MELINIEKSLKQLIVIKRNGRNYKDNKKRKKLYTRIYNSIQIGEKMNYTLPIFLALVTFMFIAFVLSIPYMIYQYFKYGSIEIIKTLIFFSFIFYLISAYYLVILPLPNQATF